MGCAPLSSRWRVGDLRDPGLPMLTLSEPGAKFYDPSTSGYLDGPPRSEISSCRDVMSLGSWLQEPEGGRTCRARSPSVTAASQAPPGRRASGHRQDENKRFNQLTVLVGFGCLGCVTHGQGPVLSSDESRGAPGEGGQAAAGRATGRAPRRPAPMPPPPACARGSAWRLRRGRGSRGR